MRGPLVLLVLTLVLTPVYTNIQTNWTQRVDDDGVTWIGPIRKCFKSDDLVLTECTRKIIEDLTSLPGSEMDEYGLTSLDPVLVEKFLYHLSLGPINFIVHSKNTVITGLAKDKTLSVKIDSKNMNAYFSYGVPYIHLKSKYKLVGNAFFFPLTGTGPAEIELYNLKMDGKIHGKIRHNSHGEEVVEVAFTDINHMSIADMNLRIRGLFGGNALLSTTVHYVGKRYAREVFEIARPKLEDYVSKLITNQLLNPILKQLPHVVEYIPRVARNMNQHADENPT